MSYLVTCTFDLKGGTSQDYQKAYAALDRLGFKRVIVSDSGGNFVVPTTMTIGLFDGPGAKPVRQDLLQRTQLPFHNSGLKAELFLVVGGDWAWGAATT